ncbi:uncharacterized protein LOC135136821 isoform X2 [Zophobas morio]|uniref:uncharacterized protein LOC135136821 isoform X2 n=1 Tax=Zophobas morio TaxID=2755281 RepID=UPI003082A242
MSVSTDVVIKKEVGPPEEYFLEEDDIKIEETCLQGTSEDSFVPLITPTTVIVERKLSVCSMCQCTFERKANIKLQHKDVSKCYKCVLHSRLSEVFNVRAKRKKGIWSQVPPKKAYSEIEDHDSDSRDSDIIITDPGISQIASFSVKKLMYVCAFCKTQFERTDSRGLREPGDWYKCNRCILHSRLNTVFQPNKPKKRKSS